MRLSKGNFTNLAAPQPNVPNVRSRIGTFTVPRGQAIAIDYNSPLLLAIPAQQTIDDGDITGALQDFELEFPIAQNANLTFDQIVFAVQDGVTVPITDIDYDTNEITFDAPVDDEDMDVWYLSRVGSVELVAIAPGPSQNELTVYNNDLAMVHQVNQHLTSAVPRVQTKLVLPHDHALSVYVDAPYSCDFGPPNAFIELQAGRKSMDYLRSQFEARGVSRNSIYDAILQSWQR